MTNWKPIPPDPYSREELARYDACGLVPAIVLAYAKDQPDLVEVFLVRGVEHGAIFTNSSGMLSLNEEGWIPFAWTELAFIPSRDAFPPMLTDYLTEAAER